MMQSTNIIEANKNYLSLIQLEFIELSNNYDSLKNNESFKKNIIFT